MPLSPPGRVSFPNLYVPTAMEEGKPKKYDVTLVFRVADMDDDDKAKLLAMQEAAQACAMEKFGCKIGEKPGGKGQPLANPFRKGSEKPDWYDDDVIFIKFSSKKPPAVVNQAKVRLEEGSTECYAGMWAHVTWSTYPYDIKGNRGVAFGLGNLQKTDDDEPFGSGVTDPDEDFEVIATEDSDNLGF